MVEQVTKWSANLGTYVGFFDTKEEAEAAEAKTKFLEGFDQLHGNKVKGSKRLLGLGSPNVVRNAAEFVWTHREFIKRLINGEELELKPEPVEEGKQK
jgi:hypothetical protein